MCVFWFCYCHFQHESLMTSLIFPLRSSNCLEGNHRLVGKKERESRNFEAHSSQIFIYIYRDLLTCILKVYISKLFYEIFMKK